MKPDRRRALVALSLLAPVPSLGVIAAMVVAPGPVGQTIFLVAKTWLLVFPAAWYLVIEKGRPSWSPPRHGGLGTGALSGVALAATIVGGAVLPLIQGKFIDDLGVRNSFYLPMVCFVVIAIYGGLSERRSANGQLSQT